MEAGDLPPPAARRWTGEQQQVILAEGAVSVVHARSGAGKTTVLRGYAKRRPQRRILYLVFNKANQLEAEASFPSNTKPQTSHALAFRVTGARYRNKLGDTKPVAVSRVFGTSNATASEAIGLVRRFLSSGCATVAAVADPRNPKDRTALPYAEQLWELMQDTNRRDVPMPHDGYLKLFDLEGHVVKGYDIILFDEAQDANPITVNILKRQQLPLVVVGDEYQAIYGFRGAVNALAQFGGEHFALTNTFRFGPEIARAANSVLAMFGERNLIVGRGGPSQLYRQGKPAGPYTFLSRTNAGVIQHGIATGTKKLHFVGGVETYRTDRILDAYFLYARMPDQVQDREFRVFSRFDQLIEYGEEIDDMEIKAIVQLVTEFGTTTPQRLEDLRARSAVPVDQAEVTMTTFHRSKGLEWDNVVLGDAFDWSKFLEEDPRKRLAKFREELHGLYVAGSRARQRLWINPTLEAIMRAYPVG
ncbi:ATP-dependent helicase (plasmid) [Xanthobacter dioxanivorans]|uniref:DNA 3'-5' helicase n=1 Tax=Xanthobacter dioxanivorans TaxID=2528964 RepID=A0A974SM54_9HYPH|nr:UvrD-helicase domain-containing protein [Xanthobacter dioxanivorans]QRG10074.1 ATP-dependent helicase [Xanthobacter dioxanivorans]